MQPEGKPVGRAGPTANLISWNPEGGPLPMRHRITGSQIPGLIALVTGLPWLYYSSNHLFGTWQRTGLEGGLFLPVLLVLGGLAFTLYGISQFVYREEYRIGPDGVSWKRFGLTGSRSWDEPLSRYNGIMKEQQYHRDSEQRAGPYQSRMSYMLFLDHDDRSRRVKLYESTNILESPAPEWEDRWKAYADLFRLPLLEKTSAGVTATDVDNYRRPLVDKLADGSVQAPDFNLAVPGLPAGLSLERQDDLWVVTIKPVKLLWSGALILASGAILFAVVYLLGGFSDMTLALGLAAVLGAGAVLYAVSMRKRFRHPDQVAVDSKSLWYRTWDNRQKDWDTDSLRIGDIQRVALGTQTNRNQLEQVIIDDGKRSFEAGSRLPAASRRTLRGLLLFLIKTSSSQGKGGD